MEPSAQQKELGAGSWSSSGGHLDVATAGSTWLQSLQTPRKLVPLELWPASPGEVPCVHPWGRVLLSPMPPSSPLERRRWRTSGPTLRCPNIPDVTYGRKKGPCRYWIHGHQAAWARRGHLDESWDGKVPWGKSASPWRTWRRRSQCSRSSLSPCAIRAVEAIVSWRDGWSNHETVSHIRITNKEALDTRFVLAGLTLYDPFDVVTACLKIWYCAAEIFLLSPSSSSSSEMALLASGSIAAVKLTGDSSRAGDSTDEDLESGERDLDSLDSLWLLACLSHGSPGLSLGRPGPSDKRTDGTLWSMEKPLWRLGSSLWSSSRHGWSPVGWVMSESRHWWMDSRTGRGLWNTRLVHPTL